MFKRREGEGYLINQMKINVMLSLINSTRRRLQIFPDVRVTGNSVTL